MNLIARLESANGADRGLDWDVRSTRYAGEKSPSGPPRRYTASIDAALTLVPLPVVAGDKGRLVELTWSESASIGATATVNHDHHGYGATPAIAICIAALRAWTNRNGT